MGGGNEERGHSYMKSLIKGYGREKRLGCTVLDNRLTYGGKAVSLTRRQLFTPQEDSWYSFLLEAASTPGPQSGWKD
jgi:hypothetical protein